MGTLYHVKFEFGNTLDMQSEKEAEKGFLYEVMEVQGLFDDGYGRYA